MPWEYEQEDIEIKDRTKWWWMAFVVLFVVMLGSIWTYGRLKSHESIVRAKHILISFNKADPADEARAGQLVRELRERIGNGESFSKLAEQYSNDPSSATRGGDLGWMPRASFLEAFEQYVWSAPIGELSDAIQTTLGYHLIIVTDRVISEIDRVKARKEEGWRKQISGGQSIPAPAPAPPAANHDAAPSK
jgi:parvulin-like peptidyl-prolyl isomerase